MGKTLGYGEITVANMTEPFTVMLTNEAQQFATDSNRKVTSAQSYYTDIIVIRGSQERTDYTIGNITSGSGITVSKNSKRVTFSVSAGTTIGADAGVIEIPITLDGQTVKKQFSWSCGKQGPQGVKGQDGNSFSWNLLQDSSFPVGTKKWNLSNGFSVCTDVKYNGYNSIKIVNQEDVRLDVPSTYFSDYTTSQDLYLTFWIMCPDVSKITNSVDSWIGFRKGYVFLPNGAIARKISKDEFEKAGNNNWFKISISAKSDDIESTTCTFMLQPNNSQATFYVACPMLSRGAIEVPYAPHPDDLIGETGKSVSKITEYYLATSASSGVTYSTSGWSTDPTTQKLTTTNKYLWNCKITEYDDGTKSQPTTPVMCGTYGETGKNGADGDSFAWNMLSETNCGKKHWGTESSGGKYSVEDFITEDNINAVKLICTEGISTSNWSYVLFKDIKMLKQLKPSTKYTLSYDIKANRSGAISHSICKGDVSNFCTNTVVVNNIIGNETWQHISVVLTTNDLKTTPTNEILYLGRNALSKVGYSIIKNLKLVEGDIDTPWSPSQSDIEGKGIAQTVQYYLATSQASGVTSSTSGWSTDITTQKLTADKKYLWNCYQTKYSDGTSEPISTPKVIGVYGDKGQKGEDGQDGAGFHWNLLKYSGDLSKQVLGGAGTYTATVESIEDKTTPSGQAEKITYTVQGTGGKFIQTGKYIKEGDIKQGKTYTVSVWCKCSSIKSTGVINAEFLDNKTYVNPTLSTEWQQYVVTGVANKDVTSTSSASAISFYYSDNMSVGDIFYISSPKVEEGDKTSPWCTTYEETLAKNLSITPSSQYFKSTDGGKTFAPNTITIKPTIQGEISFGKWQYSIDGGVSFADIVSGQKGLTISNNVLTVSKDSSLYSDAVTVVTFRAVASDSGFYDTCSIAKIYDVSDIGDGRNLLWNSNFAKTDEAITGTTNSWGLHTRGTNLVASIDTSTKHNGFNTLKTVSAANGDKNSSNDLEWFAWGISERTSDNLHSKNQNYTLSFYAKASVTTDFIVRWGYDAYGADTTRTLTTNWQKYEIKLHQATSAYSITIIFKLLTAGTVWFSEFKLEKGSSATGYSTAPEDLQTAILSTKSEISDVSLKVDNNKQAIEQRVEKTTYQQDLNLVKGDISKANEGLNKWRYEIYPKSLFADKPEDQGKYDIGVFIRNKNLTPSRTLVFDDNKWTLLDYENNYIGYGLTFVKMSAKKTFSTKWAHSSSCSIYVNGKLIISDKGTVRLDSNNTGRDFSCTFIEGWNCIEFVIQETTGNEWFFFKDAISAISECQLMNCYYGTPVARQSHITNQLVQNTTDIEGVSGSVQKVMSTVGGSGKIDEFVNNYSTWKKKVDGIETRVGETYTTKSDFNGLEIGGRNLILNSAFKKGRKEWSDWGNPTTREIVSSNGKMWAHIVGNKQNYQGFNQWTPAGSIKEGDHITFSARIKGSAANQRFTVGIHWLNSGNTIISQDWHTFIVDTTENVYTWTVNASGSGCNKLNLMVGVSDPSIVYNVYFTEIMVVKGNKATDWAPAPEDDEINGQNLVSNLPSNWEQGSFNDGKTNVGCDYDTNKSSMATRIRVKELVPVSGTITISNAYSNQSKKPIQHWITAFDVNKKWLGSSYVSTAWSDFPRIVDMKDAKYIAVIVKYKDDSAITPSDISQICLKIERGTSATPFTLAPEDVNGKIVNVETIANQTAKKFEWIVKGGDKSSSMVLTDDFLNIVANKINLKGKVTFESLSSDAKNEIGKVAQSKVDGLEIGGRNLLVQKNITQGYLSTDGKGSFIGSGGGDQTSDWIDVSGNKYITITLYEDFTNANNSGRYCEYDADKNCINTVDYNPRQKSSIIIELKTTTKYIRVTAIECKTRRYKIEAGNKATDWTPAPEDYLPQADLVSNWTTNTTWIDGGKIYTGSITADKIAANSITADKIATDAIKSRNYISSGGTQGSFLNLSDGSFTSPNLSWDANGNLIAKNANLSGEINATEGSIGKFKITDQWLITGSGSTCAGLGGSGQAFWAGAEDSTVAPFRVEYDGKLTSSNADIRGTITATNGKIGRYDITSTYLMTNSGSNASGIGGNQAFWAGAEDSNSAPFRVGYDGVLWAENAAIRGSIETGNLGDEGDTVSIINGHIGIGGTSNNVEIYSTGFKFGIDGDYYLMSVSEGVKCYHTMYATDFIADGWIYNASGGHYTWNGRTDAYISCGSYNNTNNIYYYAGYHAFYVNGDSGSGMMYIETSGVSSRKGFRNSSDERIKQNFSHFDDNFIDTYMNLEPVQYQFKNDTNDKYHFGFKAQQTERILNAYGQESDKSYGICATHAINPEKAEKLYGVKDMHEEYTLAYDELIAPTTYMVQHTYKELESTKNELEQVKQEKADLEARLQIIEAKLGL